MFYFPVAEGVELRLLEERHARSLFSLTNMNRASLRKWLPWVDDTQNVSDTLDYIRASLKQYAGNDGFQCGIWYRGELAGNIGYHLFDWRNRRTSIGYWLGEQYRGNGIMTGCVKALTEYALIDLQLNRVEIRCARGNKKSCAIPERLGFTHEGIIRDAEWLYDHFVDHHVYGMLRNEWMYRRNLQGTN